MRPKLGDHQNAVITALPLHAILDTVKAHLDVGLPQEALQTRFQFIVRIVKQKEEPSTLIEIALDLTDLFLIYNCLRPRNNQ